MFPIAVDTTRITRDVSRPALDDILDDGLVNFLFVGRIAPNKKIEDHIQLAEHYKRYVDASWAPTRLAWSRDNRTAGFRIIGDSEGLRIECRLPGADCNPYLAFAASLASGLDGIANHTEPPDHFSGDIYAAQDLPRVPYTLAEATERFASSDFAKRAFGDDVVEHYLHFFRSEQRAYDMAVTDWEIQRYFERI